MSRKESRIVLGLVIVVMLGVCYGVQRDAAFASMAERAH
jgi:hypothetical protein